MGCPQNFFEVTLRRRQAGRFRPVATGKLLVLTARQFRLRSGRRSIGARLSIGARIADFAAAYFFPDDR